MNFCSVKPCRNMFFLGEAAELRFVINQVKDAMIRYNDDMFVYCV